jgi:hypothetical protein
MSQFLAIFVISTRYHFALFHFKFDVWTHPQHNVKRIAFASGKCSHEHLIHMDFHRCFSFLHKEDILLFHLPRTFFSSCSFSPPQFSFCVPSMGV